jgi:hypothetical protein
MRRAQAASTEFGVEEVWSVELRNSSLWSVTERLLVWGDSARTLFTTFCPNAPRPIAV